MIMADVFKILFLVLGTLIVVVSYWLAAMALFPAATAAAMDVYRRHPAGITLLGALVGVPLVFLGVALLSGGPSPLHKIGGGALVSLLTLLALIGSAGLALRVGSGLPAPRDDDQPWRRVLRGGSVLSLTFVLPVIGWFGVFPWTLLSGLGAALSVLWSRRRGALRLAPEG